MSDEVGLRRRRKRWQREGNRAVCKIRRITRPENVRVLGYGLQPVDCHAVDIVFRNGHRVVRNLCGSTLDAGSRLPIYDSQISLFSRTVVQDERVAVFHPEIIVEPLLAPGVLRLPGIHQASRAEAQGEENYHRWPSRQHIDLLCHG